MKTQISSDKKVLSSAEGKQLTRHLKKLFEVYATQMSTEAAEAYRDALGDLTDYELDVAFTEALRSHDGKFPPTPAQIRRALDVARSRFVRPASRANPNCSNCSGTGFEIVEFEGAHYARKCQCVLDERKAS